MDAHRSDPFVAKNDVLRTRSEAELSDYERPVLRFLGKLSPALRLDSPPQPPSGKVVVIGPGGARPDDIL